MPLPGPEIIGFGYVKSEWVDSENYEEVLEDDSRLSSTSLLYTLIGPDPDQESTVTDLESKTDEENSLEMERMSMRTAISYVRKEDRGPPGLNIDFGELRKKDELKMKAARKHSVIIRRTELHPKWTGSKSEDVPMSSVTMPLLSSLGLKEENQAANRKTRAIGMVKELLRVIDNNVPRYRSSEMWQKYQRMILLKEQLDQKIAADWKGIDERETSSERLQREEVEDEIQKLEDTFYGILSMKENMESRTTLTERRRLSKSSGMKTRDSDGKVRTSARESLKPSYDEYHAASVPSSVLDVITTEDEESQKKKLIRSTMTRRSLRPSIYIENESLENADK